MNKLEQEAEVFVSEKADKGNFDIEQFGKAYFSESSMKQALVKFAEPREKRIEELETQIEKMKCCSNCRHYRYQVDAKYCTCVKDGKRNGKDYRSCKSFNLEKWEFNNYRR